MPTFFDRLFGAVRTSFSRKDDPAFQSYTQFLGLGNPIYTPKDYLLLAKEGYEKNVTVYRAVSLISQSCAGIPWKLYQKKDLLTSIDDHPILTLLKNPNASNSQSEFIEQVVSFWILAGNCYITTVRPSKNAEPTELWVLRPDRMRVVPGISTIAGYEYYVEGLRSYFNAPDVLHLKMFSASNDWYGLSPLLVAGALIDQQNAGFDWNTSLIQNSGRPSGALVANGTLSNDQYERLRRVIREKYIGAKNAGMPMLLEGGLTWTPMAGGPAELDWLNSRQQNARDIAVALGVPPELIGDSENRTYSNYQEARQSFYQETVLPLMDRLRDRLNVWLVEQFGSDLYLDYNKEEIEALQEDRDNLNARLMDQWASGVITLNETRVALGMDELAGGDFLQLTSTNHVFVPTANLTKVVAQSTAAVLAPPPVPKLIAPAPGGVPGDPANPVPPVAVGKPVIPVSGKPAVPAAKTPTKKPVAAPKKPGAGGKEPIPINRGKQPVAPTQKPPVKKPAAKKGRGDTPQSDMAYRFLAGHYQEQKELVCRAIKNAALPQTVELRVDAVLRTQMPALETTLVALYQKVGELAFDATREQLGIASSEQYWEQDAREYVKARTELLVEGITAKTQSEIRDALAYGTAKGESLDGLAERVGEVYDEDITGAIASSIASVEGAVATQYGAYNGAVRVLNPSLRKQWVAGPDARETHCALHMSVLPVDAPFDIAGEQLLFPGDVSLGASPANTTNCHCELRYFVEEPKEESPEESIDSLLANPTKLFARPDAYTAFRESIRKETPYGKESPQRVHETRRASRRANRSHRPRAQQSAGSDEPA